MKKTDAGPARGIREECSVKKKNTAKTRREAMNGAAKAEARAPQPEARPAEKRVPPVRQPEPAEEDAIDFAQLLDLYPAELKDDLPSSGKKGSLIVDIDLERGMPTVEEALSRMRTEMQSARMKGCRIARLIHGYGSTGRGGAIRAAVRKAQKNAIPGEEFDIFHAPARDLLNRFPALRKDRDLGSCNQGITLVVLRK